MNPENFTDKTTEAIVAAQELAREGQNPQLAPVHLAVALFSDPNGIARQILNKSGCDPQVVERNLRRLLVRLPTQDPAPDQVSPSPAFGAMLRKADDVRKKQSDSHLAVDHLLLALTETEKPIVDALSEAGLTRQAMQTAIKSVRGNKPVTGKTSEETYDALNKYGIDMGTPLLLI